MNQPDDNSAVSKEYSDALDELNRKVSIMEDIAKYNLLILMAGIEEAEARGYGSALGVMVKEFQRLAQWTTGAFDNKEGAKESLFEQNHFLKRHSN
ncbi:hypothetical protein MBAV_004431 [Candidatus Magnetobacterium bavaricum]|uniref:Uncharacterized protein n=1 Tax=Candidatus Magnetobacterium bavaricum TaxID=29290 RepID=A0A0F3GN73_9BACT|nr:hypothetical protein MBAV_004431 [Candidatus Magnetobacterium bavaricum]